jgi:hypothetical protein
MGSRRWATVAAVVLALPMMAPSIHCGDPEPPVNVFDSGLHRALRVDNGWKGGQTFSERPQLTAFCAANQRPRCRRADGAGDPALWPLSPALTLITGMPAVRVTLHRVPREPRLAAKIGARRLPLKPIAMAVPIDDTGQRWRMRVPKPRRLPMTEIRIFPRGGERSYLLFSFEIGRDAPVPAPACSPGKALREGC